VTPRWTLWADCPDCPTGTPLSLVNSVPPFDPAYCTRLLVIAGCPDGHEWELEVRMHRIAAEPKRTRGHTINERAMR